MADVASSPLVLVAAVALAVWVQLFAFRGGFWRARPRLDAGTVSPPAEGDPYPPVVAVVPARDEAATVGASVRSLLAQDYPAPFSVVLVDDGSDDGTAAYARRAAAEVGAGSRLEVISSKPLPPGWTGKMWAVSQGVERAEALAPDGAYLWLTDADIGHHHGELRALVAKAESEGLDLVSVMVLLRCESLWERLLIPAFVFFFQKLYPFPWVNDPRRRTAAAAGGSMLVRREALRRAGGIAAIRGALIDDCALARNIKQGGPIWLGLTKATKSLRPYAGLGEIWRMVARTAYTQLDHSPLLLAAAVLGMVGLYLVPPAAAVVGGLAGSGAAAALGVLAWLLMAGSFLPTLRLYRQPAPAALLLPVAALLYCAMTLDSARHHWLGRSGLWKGRTFVPRPNPARPSGGPADRNAGKPTGGEPPDLRFDRDIGV